MSKSNNQNLNNGVDDAIQDGIASSCFESLLSTGGGETDVFAEPELEVDGLFDWIVEGVLILVAFFVGMLGNSFSIIVFSRQKVHRIFHHLLLLLAIFDMVSGCGI